jgi:hypothetical protein
MDHNADKLTQQQTEQLKLEIEKLRGGHWDLVLNNRFSLLSAKAVQFNATMTYYL